MTSEPITVALNNWVLSGWEIPPKSEYMAVGGCSISSRMSVVNVLPYVHPLGRRFTAEFLGGSLDGQRFLDSPRYRSVGVTMQYRPAVALSPRDGVQFACTWKNTFDKPCVEGIGDKAMCMLFGYGYPYENTYSVLAMGPARYLYLALLPLN